MMQAGVEGNSRGACSTKNKITIVFMPEFISEKSIRFNSAYKATLV